MIHFRNWQYFTAFFIFCLFSDSLVSQTLTVPFQQDYRVQLERHYLGSGNGWHPVWPAMINADEDTVQYADIRPFSSRFARRAVGRKLFSESLIRVNKPDFRLIIDPLVNFSAGKQTDPERNTWVNTRGFRADGTIGRDFSFHTAFYESQAVFATWTDSVVRQLSVVPGQAKFKPFKENGFDYAFSEGHINYTPSKYFNFRFGHGRNFFGDGYRSLLLSDVAFNYPYLMVTTKVWKLQYVNLYAQMMDLRMPRADWDPWHKKYTTMHYLTMNVTPWLNLGIFEAIVWNSGDSTGNRGFDINYLNPVIFYRPVEFSMGSPDNALLGGSLRINLREKAFLYAQLMLDEFKLDHVLKGDGWWANKHGFQLGFKIFDPFDVKNLFLQAEYNHVRPYTYAHNESVQNYGHYNQPLAHPLGANFRETDVIVSYRIQRWLFDYKLVYSIHGIDTAGLNFGGDIYKPYLTYVTEFGNKIGQGLKSTLMVNDLRVGWLVNPATNLQLNAGITLRNEISGTHDYSGVLIWFGLRSSLFNLYYDW
ncbi:MAG: hypothetical protein IPF68_13610 [Bacteroidales bacterium]|nr:hypothetical protein [Bacteroidales bacterium]